MSWIKVISEDEAEGELAQTYHQAKSITGRVANIIKITSLRPEVTRALVQLRQAIRSPRASLSARRQEMIATVASALNQCTY